MNDKSHKIFSLICVFTKIKLYLQKINENNQNKIFNEFEKELDLLIIKSKQENPWFEQKNIHLALNYWIKNLNEQNLKNWLEKYKIDSNKESKKVGLILAGNIPLVGFHDILCVILTGNFAKIKLSSKDSKLIPFILNEWKNEYSEIKFEFVERLIDYDLVIATGSENTSKYFEYYFKNKPHIIRKNRTSLGIISGNESNEDLQNLAKDIFTYFGLGCRNVTQLFLPKDFQLNRLFENFMEFSDFMFHHKYANNYDYHKAIFLLNQDEFWDNNFVLIRQSKELFSPLSVLFISYYENIQEINDFIKLNEDKIQCIVSENKNLDFKTINFGETQDPKLNDYADGLDTIDFLFSNRI